MNYNKIKILRNVISCPLCHRKAVKAIGINIGDTMLAMKTRKPMTVIGYDWECIRCGYHFSSRVQAHLKCSDVGDDCGNCHGKGWVRI